jgi:hypothetical protein
LKLDDFQISLCMKIIIILTTFFNFGTDILYICNSFFFYESLRIISFFIIISPTIIYCILYCWSNPNSLMRRHLRFTIEIKVIKPYMEFFWIEGNSIFFGLIKTNDN